MFDAAWVRNIVNNVMVPVVRLFLQNLATVTTQITTIETLLTDKFTTIEDYGAVGDGVTDDTNAFFSYIAALRAAATAGNPEHIFRLGSARTYLVSNSLDFTKFTDMTFDFSGSTVKITGVTLTAPLIDMLGCSHCRLINGYVYANDSMHPLTLGLLLGRVNGASAPNITLSNFHIEGYFSRAGVQNSASDFVTGDGLKVINHATGATAVGIIHDALGTYNTPSVYVTGNTVSNSYGVTCNNLDFNNSTIQTSGGAAIWKSGSSRDHVENNCNFSVPATSALFVLALQPDTDSTPRNRAATIKAMQITNLTASPHTEMFFMTGAAADYYLEDLLIAPTTIQSTANLFTIDTGYPSALVKLIDATLSIPHWASLSAVVFDVPARYAVTGDIEILEESSVVWNAPSVFNGKLKTDDHTHFSFNAASVVNCADQAGWWMWFGLGWHDLTNTRIRLTANAQFYVATTGNDSTGTGTSAAPWATPQYAHEWIYKNIDFNGFTVTLNIGAGVFPGLFIYGPAVGQMSLVNYLIVGTGATTELQASAATNGCGISAVYGGSCLVNNLKVSASYTSVTGDYLGGGFGIAVFDNGLIGISNITFGTCGVYQMFAASGGHIVSEAAYIELYVTGNAQAFAYVDVSGFIELPDITITFLNPVTYSVATVYAIFHGSVRVQGCNFVNSTYVTGQRYSVDYFASITTNGGGPNFIPGTSPGTVSVSGTPASYM